MGVSAKLYISKNQFSGNVDLIRMLSNTIQEQFGDQKITTEAVRATEGDYIVMLWTDGINPRQLNIFLNSSVGGFPAIQLDLGANDNSDKLFTAIGERMGGIFTSNDCGDQYKVFQDPMEGNEEWLLKQIRAGINVVNNTQRLISHLKKRV